MQETRPENGKRCHIFCCWNFGGELFSTSNPFLLFFRWLVECEILDLLSTWTHSKVTSAHEQQKDTPSFVEPVKNPLEPVEIRGSSVSSRLAAKGIGFKSLQN